MRYSRIVVAAVACAGLATAWQSALSAVGWSEGKAAQIAENYFTSGSSLLYTGSMSPETKLRWIGKSPAERATAIRELALHAKRYVQTPAFEKLYVGWIKERYNAVNHGIKVDSKPATAEDLNSAMSEVASMMAESFKSVPPEGIRMLLTNDIDSLKGSTEEKDKALLARFRKVESLLKTDLPEARKQYAFVKAMQMSGQTNDADTQAALQAGAKAAADRKRMDEQRAWDQHNLKTELRRRLTDFVTLAESVDFAAQTQRNAGKMVFSDAKLEGKSGDWKVLYRLGKEPTLAAVAVAKQWLREL